MNKDISPKLETKSTLSMLDKFERKVNEQGVVREGKRLTLFISNEDVNNMNESVESLKN